MENFHAFVRTKNHDRNDPPSPPFYILDERYDLLNLKTNHDFEKNLWRIREFPQLLCSNVMDEERSNCDPFPSPFHILDERYGLLNLKTNRQF